MSAESDLHGWLSGHAALTALVGTRIYPDAMPEAGAYPAVVFSRVATEPILTIGSLVAGEFVTFAIGCWARSRTDVDAVAVAVIGALVASGEVPTGRIGGFDPETGLYSTVIDTRLLG